MDCSLRNKVALVTGGSHGIGLAIALELASEGCNIVICSRSMHRLLDAKNEIAKHNVLCEAIQCDVSNEEQIVNCVHCAIEIFGTIHVLVNNVGGGGRWGDEDPCKTDAQVWKDVYHKNVDAAVSFTMLCLPYMREQKWGRVIAVTSRYGIEIGGRPWFNMAKVSEGVFIKNMSQQKHLVRNGITFNVVAPGDIMIQDTGWDEERKHNQHFQQMLEDEYPMGHMGSPADVAAAVAFLCSAKAGYINGATIAVDGGQSVRL